jgi:hypothetical protein
MIEDIVTGIALFLVFVICYYTAYKAVFMVHNIISQANVAIIGG